MNNHDVKWHSQLTIAATSVVVGQLPSPRSEQEGMALGYTFLLWGSKKRTGTQDPLDFLWLLLLPPSHCHQLVKLMATRWHLTATYDALSSGIALILLN